ncbi:MAG: cupin domain-containing protein [Gammaproteobacteria bacterium]
MARIIFPDNSETQDLPTIQSKLAQIGITLRYWPAPEHARARELLDQAVLSDAEKEELLCAVDDRFDILKAEAGFATRDMIVLHEDLAGLPEMLGKFDKVHYHTDYEVRYILAGRGYFGFVDPDGDQFMLEVSAGDYINVPAHTEHWFKLGDSRRIKAVRYFIDTSGWSPVYTERPIVFE